MKPGTPGRCVSREVHTSSNAASAPGRTLKRFIAMNMGRFLLVRYREAGDASCYHKSTRLADSSERTPMAASPIHLIRSRRLWPLTLAQSCGALNDNLVKNAMIVLAIFRLGVGGAGLSALAGALFIAPYILLSATAGKLADRLAKPRLVVIYKAAEVLLMAAAAAAFLFASVPALLAVLVGLGVQAALFGPVKYGVLPEYLAENELLTGNGIIEATTFLSIVCGTVAGGGLILLDPGPAVVGATGMALALLGLFGALRMPDSD